MPRQIHLELLQVVVAAFFVLLPPKGAHSTVVGSAAIQRDLIETETPIATASNALSAVGSVSGIPVRRTEGTGIVLPALDNSTHEEWDISYYAPGASIDFSGADEKTLGVKFTRSIERTATAAVYKEDCTTAVPPSVLLNVSTSDGERIANTTDMFMNVDVDLAPDIMSNSAGIFSINKNDQAQIKLCFRVDLWLGEYSVTFLEVIMTFYLQLITEASFSTGNIGVVSSLPDPSDSVPFVRQDIVVPPGDSERVYFDFVYEAKEGEAFSNLVGKLSEPPECTNPVNDSSLYLEYAAANNATRFKMTVVGVVENLEKDPALWSTSDNNTGIGFLSYCMLVIDNTTGTEEGRRRRLETNNVLQETVVTASVSNKTEGGNSTYSAEVTEVTDSFPSFSSSGQSSVSVSVSASLGYALSACPCSADGICDSSIVLDQSSVLYICLSLDDAFPEDVHIADVIDLEFRQGGESVRFPVVNRDRDTLTSFYTNGLNATIETKPLSARFEDSSPDDLIVRGSVLLGFGPVPTSSRRERHLHDVDDTASMPQGNNLGVWGNQRWLNVVPDFEVSFQLSGMERNGGTGVLGLDWPKSEASSPLALSVFSATIASVCAVAFAGMCSL